jgi:hypothetical protein
LPANLGEVILRIGVIDEQRHVWILLQVATLLPLPVDGDTYVAVLNDVPNRGQLGHTGGIDRCDHSGVVGKDFRSNGIEHADDPIGLPLGVKPVDSSAKDLFGHHVWRIKLNEVIGRVNDK